MKKIIRNLGILTAFIIVFVIASCSTSTKKMSIPMPAPPGDMRMLKFCKDNEIENDNCKKMGPTATGADRGVQEDPKELP